MNGRFGWLRGVVASLPGVGLAGWLAWTSLQARAQSPTAGAPAAGAATKVYLNKTTVNLPIMIDERQRPQVASVQLYVKQGASQPWMLCDKALATQASFTFSAPQEGEYWFNIVSVDKVGRMTPSDIGKEGPAVVVVLDTQAPQVDVKRLKAESEGQYLTCQMRDAYLDGLKSRVFYQTGDQLWRSLDSQPGKADTYCIPAQAAWNGNIRVVAVDLAGNTTTKEMNLHQPAPPAVNAVLPAAAQPKTNSTAPVASAQSELPPVTLTAPQAPPADPAPLPPSILQTKAMETNPPRAIENTAPPMPTRQRTLLPRDMVLPPTPSITKVETTRELPLPRPFVEQQFGPGALSVSQKLAPSAPPLIDPASEHRPQNVVHEMSTATPIVEPASMRRQFTNATRVFLDYRIEALGASGVGKVEVWCTRDLGQTWLKLCEDTDRQSPVEVNLPGEGVYGVTLAISNGRGFGGAPPKSGDTPEMWIEVDTTKPTAKIMDIRPGTGEDSGALHIAWSARDKNLAGDSVELQCSTKREGPWQSIAKGLKSDGVYRWKAPVAIGPSTYLRMTVRDQADNIASVDTPQAVPLDDASRPRGRLLGISAAQQNDGPLLPILP